MSSLYLSMLTSSCLMIILGAVSFSVVLELKRESDVRIYELDFIR